jgi:DNA-binding transcriptional LysR family regulator
MARLRRNDNAGPAAGHDLPELLESGALVRVLEDWCPPFAGYFLYYPSRRQQPAALSVLIDTLRS